MDKHLYRSGGKHVALRPADLNRSEASENQKRTGIQHN
ncbi:hypothetical protein A2U01_0108177, partial [Trifolium medium]|nr:hypothetical protein [Trifolium medium]